MVCIILKLLFPLLGQASDPPSPRKCLPQPGKSSPALQHTYTCKQTNLDQTMDSWSAAQTHQVPNLYTLPWWPRPISMSSPLDMRAQSARAASKEAVNIMAAKYIFMRKFLCGGFSIMGQNIMMSTVLGSNCGARFTQDLVICT